MDLAETTRMPQPFDALNAGPVATPMLDLPRVPFTSEAPVTSATFPPRADVTPMPPHVPARTSRIAPWIAVAAIVGVGVGLIARGDLSRGAPDAPARAAAPAAPARDLAPEADAREAHDGQPQPVRDDAVAMAGVAETSAIARPAARWRSPAPQPVASTAAPAADVGPPAGDAEATPTTPVEPAADAAPAPEQAKESATDEAPADAEAPAEEPAAVAPFDRGAASVGLAAASGKASRCRTDDAPSGITRVSVTFAPSGRVTQATVSGPPYAGTATGGCIAQAFRGVTIAPFQGAPVTVTKSVSIP